MVSVDVLHHLGMLVSAGVIFYRQESSPKEAEDLLLLSGDNISTVTWVNKCGGSRDHRAYVLMRLLGRLEVVSGYSHLATHGAGVDNVLADGVSKSNRGEIRDRLPKHTNELPWNEVNLGIY